MRYSVSLLGPLSGRLTSFLGGVKFNKNGTLVAFTNPAQPNSPAQQEVKAAFSFLTSEWTNTLSDTQRLAWKTARDSDPYYLTSDDLNGIARKYGSAKDLFIAMNMNYMVMDGSLSTPATQYVLPGTSAGGDSIGVTSFIFDASAGTAILTYTGAFTLMGSVVKATPPLSAGTMILPKAKLRTVATGIGVSPAALGAAYVLQFGAITSSTGKKVFWQIEGVDILTGKSVVLVSSSSIVVA